MHPALEPLRIPIGFTQNKKASQERTDAQLEQWCAEFEYFESRLNVIHIAGDQLGEPREQQIIDHRVTEWLRREARALRFRRILYGQT